jgi:hypothetical protein
MSHLWPTETVARPCRTSSGPGPGVPPSGGFVRNKPNFGRARGSARSIAPNKPNLPSGGQEQSCETDPIPAEGKKWQVPGREEVMVNGTSDQPRQNKANFQACPFARNKANLGRWLAPRARGTNKANWREWPIVRNKPNSVREQETASARRAKSYGVLAIQTAPTKRTQFPAMPGGAPGMWDAGQMCKTNPISDEVKRDEAPGAWDAGATVRNKANSRQTKGRVQWQHEYERRRL